MATWILTNGASDLSGGDDFNNDLGASAAAADINIGVAASGQETNFAWTISDIPNNDDWEDGDIIVEVNVTTGGDLDLKINAHRVNSSGTVQESQTQTGSQNCLSTGILTFTISGATWTAGAASDRLRIDYEFTNPSSMGNTQIKIEANTTDCEVVTSITIAGGAFTMAAAVGTFTLTGIAAGLKAGRKIASSLGTFTLTGIATGLAAGRKMAAAVGTFTWTGIAANLIQGFSIVASVGTFTLTGIDTGLKAARTILASLGTFTLTGIATPLVAARKLVAIVGTFTLTGIATPLRAARKMTTAVGTFTFTGIDAGLRAGRKIAAAVGVFVLSGKAVIFLFSGGGAFAMAANKGTFTMTVIAVNLVVVRRLPPIVTLSQPELKNVALVSPGIVDVELND